jgi:hydrogenase maturation protease
MKKNVVIGLGNSLMGDDGIGCYLAAQLAADGRLPADTDVLCAGTDLLRRAGDMEGRRRVVLLDATLGDGEPGAVTVYVDPPPELEDGQGHAHHPSVLQTVRLLQMTSPSLSAVRFTLMLIAIESAHVRAEISPALMARVPRILDRVLAALQQPR